MVRGHTEREASQDVFVDCNSSKFTALYWTLVLVESTGATSAGLVQGDMSILNKVDRPADWFHSGLFVFEVSCCTELLPSVIII